MIRTLFTALVLLIAAPSAAQVVTSIDASQVAKKADVDAMREQVQAAADAAALTALTALVSYDVFGAPATGITVQVLAIPVTQ